MTSEPDAGGRVVRTRRWTVLVAASFLFLGLGVVSRSPGLVLPAAVGITLVGYGAWNGPPADVSDVRIRRTAADAPLRSTNAIDVTVTVTNEGDRFVPDLRIVDGVPSAFEVLEGTPRCGVALRPGESIEFEYTAAAARGEHSWGPARVTVANSSGSLERVTTIESEQPTTVRCAPIPMTPGDLPPRDLTSLFEGRVSVDAGGDGVEFFATRRYQHGDPYRRVDWKRFARTGELGTIQFRNERSVKAVLVIDARKRAYLAPEPDATHAVDRSVAAAGSIFDVLLESGDRAGLAVFGRQDVWLPPGAGDGHRARAHAVLADTAVVPVVKPRDERYGAFLDERHGELLEQQVDRLRRRLPADAQVVCLSPCCDDFMPSVMRKLDAHGHPVTMISTDPTATDTPDQYFAHLARALRLQILARNGLRVIDWDASEPLESAIARAQARWG